MLKIKSARTLLRWRSALPLASVFTFMLALPAAYAVEFKTIGVAPAILYDAPSEKGRKVFIAPRGMPVEVVLTYGEWVKVRDAAGDLSWVAARGLTSKRNLVVNVSSAKIYGAPDDNSNLLFSADKGVLLELSEPIANGWAKVRHHDGVTGYVKTSEVWGE